MIKSKINKDLPRKIYRLIIRQIGSIDELYIDEAIKYIDDYWSDLTQKQTQNDGTLIGLPNAYVIPAAQEGEKFNFSEQYYWDSYFIAIGLVESGQKKMAEGMLDNLIYLFETYGFIPTANRMYFMSRSQPPLLTSYIRLIYDSCDKDHAWLKKMMKVAEAEYNSIWMNEHHPFWHNIHRGLSRYYDINVLHDLAEAESGWDMTPRFGRKCLDYLPIDLNCLLFKYEADFAWAHKELGDKKATNHWNAVSGHRKHVVSRVMWNKRKGFFFDYNFVKGSQSETWSLAGYYAMWSGLATEGQAKQLVKALSKFEQAGGLVTTIRPLVDTSIFGSLRTQWAYPNGWAPLQYMAVEGLENYGYRDEASRIAKKWIQTNLGWFERHGVFQEKYNVVKPKKHAVEGVYPSQNGFGWTNAIFLKFCHQYLGEGSDERST